MYTIEIILSKIVLFTKIYVMNLDRKIKLRIKKTLGLIIIKNARQIFKMIFILKFMFTKRSLWLILLKLWPPKSEIVSLVNSRVIFFKYLL